MRLFKIIFSLLVLSLVGCNEPDYGTTPDVTVPSLGTPLNNEIWFTATDNRGLFAMDQTAFNAAIDEIEYVEYGISVIRFVEDVTIIGDGAFSGCTNLKNISIPDSVREIGKEAFFDCKNLEAITLGAGLRSCGAKAFDNCINLFSLHIYSVTDWCKITFADKSSNPAYYSQVLLRDGEKIKELNIPNGITAISPYAFCGNIYLTSISIPASVESIGVDAFAECESVKKVEISNISKWCTTKFSNESANPVSITQELYMNGKLITAVNISGVEEVSAYAFINCTSIESFTSDSALLHIGDNAFRNCSSLKTVDLGSGTKELGAQAFMNCSKLNSVTIRAIEPPMLANNNVFALNAENRTFAVPAASLGAYTNDTMWGKYKDFLTVIE